MSIRVLFFASIADLTGSSELELEPAGFRDVASIFERVAREFPGMASRRSAILYAVNSEFARPDTQVRDGDEVAFFPPVSGG
jgi:molybdopterin converting factor subunit 1